MTVLTEPTVYFNIWNELFYWEVDGKVRCASEFTDNPCLSSFQPEELISKSDPNNPDSFFFPITNLEYILS